MSKSKDYASQLVILGLPGCTPLRGEGIVFNMLSEVTLTMFGLCKDFVGFFDLFLFLFLSGGRRTGRPRFGFFLY